MWPKHLHLSLSSVTFSRASSISECIKVMPTPRRLVDCSAKVESFSCTDLSSWQFIPQLITLHASGKLPFERIVTQYKSNQLEKAFHDLESGKVVKPVIVFDWTVRRLSIWAHCSVRNIALCPFFTRKSAIMLRAMLAYNNVHDVKPFFIIWVFSHHKSNLNQRLTWLGCPDKGWCNTPLSISNQNNANKHLHLCLGTDCAACIQTTFYIWICPAWAIWGQSIYPRALNKNIDNPEIRFTGNSTPLPSSLPRHHIWASSLGAYWSPLPVPLQRSKVEEEHRLWVDAEALIDPSLFRCIEALVILNIYSMSNIYHNEDQ